MRFYAHIAFGFFLSGFIISDWSPVLFSLVLFFSVLPDIDYPYSFIGSMFPSISKFLFKKFGHRGLIHSIYIPVSLVVDFFLFNNYIALVVGLVFTSHIVLDMFTKSGVQLLNPLNYSFVLLDGDLETNSLKHNLLVTTFSLAGFIVWLLYKEWLIGLIW
ncbi:MAG TPA: metal-dependent hydrolase [Candidatus Nanoarchaeia archaeon]|nr:metal-dependent hydrolase [Candidatus Nanoarchaeia archaeon]